MVLGIDSYHLGTDRKRDDLLVRHIGIETEITVAVKFDFKKSLQYFNDLVVICPWTINI